MAFNLATAKDRLGIPADDTSRDAQITGALNVSLAMAEKYCDRRFAFVREVARFPLNNWPQLLVRRYPIVRVYALRLPPNGQEADVSELQVHHEHGIVYMCGCGGYRTTDAVELDYEGGFKVLPADLEFALWLVFDQVWSTTPGMGLPAGSTSADGAVRSFSIDGMSIGYDTSAAQGNAGGGGASAWGAIPAWAIAVLDLYRAESVVGVG
jgi:hypothetical protein